MKRLILLGLLVVAVLPVSGCQKSVESQLPKEFVCYDDGKLVERHVGVSYTNRWFESNTWEIHYVDSDVRAFYTQPEGETCQVEVLVE